MRDIWKYLKYMRRLNHRTIEPSGVRFCRAGSDIVGRKRGRLLAWSRYPCIQVSRVRCTSCATLSDSIQGLPRSQICSACPCDSIRIYQVYLLIHSKSILQYLTVFTPKGKRRMKMDFGFHFKSFLDFKCQTVIEWTRCRCFDLPFCKTLLGVSKFLEYLGVEACQTCWTCLSLSELGAMPVAARKFDALDKESQTSPKSLARPTCGHHGSNPQLLQDTPSLLPATSCNILQHRQLFAGPRLSGFSLQACNITSLARRSIESIEGKGFIRMSLSFLSKGPKWQWGNTQVASERKARGFRHAAPQSPPKGLYRDHGKTTKKQLRRLNWGDKIKSCFGHWAQATTR